jgi:hypothetical protein
MAKRVFFSFHYDDVKTFRANVVRNHWVTKEHREAAGFFDASIWEDAKLHGDTSVKRLINTNLENTSVTCLLIGSQTYLRRWVRYEILKSYDRGNALLGIHINGIKDKNQQVLTNGKNPYDYLGFVVNSDGTKFQYYEHNGTEWKIYNDLPPKNVSNIDRQHWGKGFKLSDWVKCYDWNLNNGYESFSNWVDSSK